MKSLVSQVRLRYLHVNDSGVVSRPTHPSATGLPHPMIRPGSDRDPMDSAEIVLVPMDQLSHNGQVVLRHVVSLKVVALVVLVALSIVRLWVHISLQWSQYYNTILLGQAIAMTILVH